MMLMNITPDQKDLQASVKTETTPTWLDCIVEELDDAAQAAVMGGGKKKSTSDSIYPTDYDPSNGYIYG
jgi:hypothetical protein